MNGLLVKIKGGHGRHYRVASTAPDGRLLLHWTSADGRERQTFFVSPEYVTHRKEAGIGWVPTENREGVAA